MRIGCQVGMWKGGEFEDDPKTRAEFMDLLRHRRESFA